MTEIFKTNVQTEIEALLLTRLLGKIFSEAKINFDLEDCDKILRIEGLRKNNNQIIIDDLNKYGFCCEVLN